MRTSLKVSYLQESGAKIMITIKPKIQIYFFQVFALLFFLEGFAQNHIQVQGKNIIGPCGDTILLRGINYAPYNWGWSPDQLGISQLVKIKANCFHLE